MNKKFRPYKSSCFFIYPVKLKWMKTNKHLSVFVRFVYNHSCTVDFWVVLICCVLPEFEPYETCIDHKYARDTHWTLIPLKYALTLKPLWNICLTWKHLKHASTWKPLKHTLNLNTFETCLDLEPILDHKTMGIHTHTIISHKSNPTWNIKTACYMDIMTSRVRGTWTTYLKY